MNYSPRDQIATMAQFLIAIDTKIPTSGKTNCRYTLVQRALGPLNELGARGVAFDVATDDVKMLVVLHGKTLAAALVNMALARRMIVSVITHRVRRGDPTQELAHPSAFVRTENQMPMIGQQLIGKQRNRIALQALGKDALERIMSVSNRNRHAS